MKLTVGWLDSRKEPRNRPKARQEKTVDGHSGLMVWVYPSGEVVFVFRYTPPGTPSGARRKMRLGQYGEGGITLAEAFDLHRQAQRELEKGLDPIEERERRIIEAQKAREEHTAAGTVADVVDQFVHRKLRAERWDAERQAWVRDTKAKTKPRKRPDDAEALLKANLVDATLDGQNVGRVKVRDLTRRQMVRILEAIVDRGSPVTANRVHALLRQLFDWTAARDIIGASPMAGVERPGGEEQPRNRKLTEAEIRTFWSKLDDADMADPTRLALKFLLVTAQRRGEFTFAKWSHFDLDAKLWTIPVELLKSSHARRSTPEPHVVPLSPFALDLLDEIKNLTGEGPFVLPARADKRKNRSYSERVLSRAVRENEKHFGILHFTPHDLRRTAASFMTKLKVPRLHVEKVLNHSTGDIAEVYDRHDYLSEKREALERWATHLRRILDGTDRDAGYATSASASMNP